jgi:hypothetical protein
MERGRIKGCSLPAPVLHDHLLCVHTISGRITTLPFIDAEYFSLPPSLSLNRYKDTRSHSLTHSHHTSPPHLTM